LNPHLCMSVNVGIMIYDSTTTLFYKDLLPVS
jgi:hypothetical protein